MSSLVKPQAISVRSKARQELFLATRVSPACAFEERERLNPST